MNRMVITVLAFGLLVAVVPSGCTSGQKSGCTSAPKDEQARAIAEIEKMGGEVTVDATSPGPPIIIVGLGKTNATDADLERLKGLTQLQKLGLNETQVTDAGLEQLKGLTLLTFLNLRDTQVTDAGLEHLKGLSQLRKLDLQNTQVTDAGVKDLEKASRTLKIIR